MDYAHYLKWLFPIVSMLFVIWTWRLDVRLYKGNYWRAVKGTYAAAINSRAKFFIWASVYVLVGGGFFYILGGREFLFLVCSYIAVALTTVSWVVRPPGVVILASSKSQQARQLARSFAWTAMGYRILYFFDPLNRQALTAMQSSPLDGVISDLINNRFSRVQKKWNDVIFALLELVPVIIIDARRLSAGLRFEMEHINFSPSLLSKTLVVVNDRSEVVGVEYSQLASRTIRPTELQGAVTFALADWKGRSLHSSLKSRRHFLLPLSQCSTCGTPMKLLTGAIIYNREVRTQGCFQCKSCARLTCYECSDNRLPCECGQKQWVERSCFLE